jgi:hypothetical protein
MGITLSAPFVSRYRQRMAMMDSSNTLPEKLWTSTQVAKYLQITEESVRRLARQGKIIGFKIGDGPKADWRFDPVSVRNFLQLRSVSQSAIKE